MSYYLKVQQHNSQVQSPDNAVISTLILSTTFHKEQLNMDCGAFLSPGPGHVYTGNLKCFNFIVFVLILCKSE